MPKKPKLKLKVNNRMKEYGNYNDGTGILEVNVKKHRKDKSELKDTLAHELYHRKHPKATEKTTYRKVKGQIHNKEATKLLKKLHKGAYSA